MDVQRLAIPGAALLTRRLYVDRRGDWSELYHRETLASLGFDAEYVQDNASTSARGVLRGLHFQHPHPQAKLVTVVSGSVFDVCVDVRVGSPTFGTWFGATLSAENGQQMLIPPGCAHGFLSLRDGSVTVYKVSGAWMPEVERVVNWKDPVLGIHWPIEVEPVLCDRDADAPTLAHLDANGLLPRFSGSA